VLEAFFDEIEKIGAYGARRVWQRPDVAAKLVAGTVAGAGAIVLGNRLLKGKKKIRAQRGLR